MTGAYTDADDGASGLLSEAIARSAAVLVQMPAQRDPATARFQRHGGSGIALAMHASSAPQPGASLTVFFCAGFQLYWFHTRCVASRRVDSTGWLITVETPDELPPAERRRDARIPLPTSLPLTAHLVVSSGLVERVPVLDICAGGASLAVPKAEFGVIRSGAHGDVTFCAATLSLQVHARVAQVKDGQCGLEFVRALSDPLALYALDGVVAAARDYWLRDITARSA